MRDAPGHHPQGGEFFALEDVLLEGSSLGQVASDRDDAAHLVGIVTNRGTGPIDRNQLAGTRHQAQLLKLHSAAIDQPLNDRRHGIPLIRIAQFGQQPTPYRVNPKARDALGGRVPTDDAALGVGGDHQVVGAFDHARQVAFGHPGLLAQFHLLGDIVHHQHGVLHRVA